MHDYRIGVRACARLRGMAPAIRTARERAREELTHEIKAEARRQLAEQGAQQLSLRAVARELGMASSAVYRYFPSRDELLTALIVDAYNDLGAHAERAVEQAAPSSGPAGADGPAAPRAGWRALCHAVRDWALANPHEYALLYGSPVPGYAAPQETIAPASRVALVCIRLFADAAPQLTPPLPARPIRGELAEQLTALAAAVAPDLGPAHLARALAAWTQLFGMISFELFGHLVGSVDPSAPFFAYTVEATADTLGLPD